MSYPKWFPRPKSWLWAFILSFLVFPFYITSKVLLGIALVTGSIINHPFLVYPVLILGFMIVPIWLIAIVHKFLWGKEKEKLPKWLPSKQDFLEGGYSWLCLVISLAIIGVAVSTGTEKHPIYQLRKFAYFNPRDFILILLPMTAYAYHLKSLIGAKFQAKRAP